MKQAIKVVHMPLSDQHRVTMLGGVLQSKYNEDMQHIVKEFEQRNFDSDVFKEDMFVRPVVGNETFCIDSGKHVDAVLVRMDKQSGKMIRSPLQIDDGFSVTTQEVCVDIT